MPLDMEVIKSIPIFAGLDDASLAKIASVTKQRAYKKGSIIFMEDEPGKAFFFVKSGKVKIYRTSPEGQQHIIHIFGPGEVFAEATVFADVTYPATAEALEDSQIGVIDNADLEALIQEDTALALSIIKILAKRLRMASEEIRNLAVMDAAGRTAMLLLQLAEQYGEKTPDGIIIALDVPRQELANMAGITRETLARVLSRFNENGIIQLDKYRIIIRDMEALMDEAY